jgi:hydroxymethylpyrimidine/phosphomethylpyrimidine kinase
MVAHMATEKQQYCALTIAGSDSCGGAGIQADIRTFTAFGVYGASVISAVTAQNTLGVSAVELMPDALLRAQLQAVLEDLPVRAVKTGMLPGISAIELIASLLERQKHSLDLVVDPVLTATSGPQLSSTAALSALKQHLFPLARLVTPNLAEACALTGIRITTLDEMEAAGLMLLDSGCTAVLMKGGHLSSGTQLTDLLITASGVVSFSHPARPGQYHGTGCTLSAAIAAGLASGQGLENAVSAGIAYVQECLQLSQQPLKGSIRLLGFKHPDVR